MYVPLNVYMFVSILPWMDVKCISLNNEPGVSFRDACSFEKI